MELPKIGIIIASHISNSKRIIYLNECLQSLTDQSLICPIYLSISFENEELKTTFEQTVQISEPVHLFIRSEKTPQMRHIESLIPVVKAAGIEWTMFSDDDDSYHPDRTQVFSQRIHRFLKEIAEHNICKQPAGIYESMSGRYHEESRHEFWCYCVSLTVLEEFYIKLYAQGTIDIIGPIIDHRCCDIIFAEYLRRLCLGNHIFSRIAEPYYNYRIQNNEDSVTGYIKEQQTTIWQPMIVSRPEDIPAYMVLVNKYLDENLHIYIHDVFLRTSVCCDFDTILRAELKADYQYIEHIDECHIAALKEHHENIKRVIDGLYTSGEP